MIDYAQHLIQIENLTKQASLLCLDGKFKEAGSVALLIASECRLLNTTLHEMQRIKEKQEEARKK